MGNGKSRFYFDDIKEIKQKLQSLGVMIVFIHLLQNYLTMNLIIEIFLKKN